MAGPTVSLIIFYRCEVAVDQNSLPRLQKMITTGEFSANNFTLRGNQAVMVLNRNEISKLRAQGFKIRVESVLFL